MPTNLLPDEGIIDSAMACLEQFYTGPFSFIKSDLREYLKNENDENNDFYKSHKDNIVSYSMVKSMLIAETRGWTVNLDSAYLRRRIGEKLTSIAYMFVPGLDTDFLTALSSEFYEGVSAKNSILVLFPSKASFRRRIAAGAIEFGSDNHIPFKYANKHAIRKQMNTGNDDMLLAAYYNMDDECYYTIGIVPVEVLKDYFYVFFPSHMHWELCYPILPGIDTAFLNTLSNKFLETSSITNLCLVLFPSLDSFHGITDGAIEYNHNDRLLFESEKTDDICRRMSSEYSGMLPAAYYDIEHERYHLIGRVPDTYRSECQYYVCPSGHFQWTLYYPKNITPDERICLVQYKYGIMQFPQLDLKREYTNYIKNLFGMSDTDSEILARLIPAAEQASKGTVLIIAKPEVISIEAEYLVQKYRRGICFPNQPPRLDSNSSLMRSFSSIDGAILLDTSCNCHAFGVILDGRIDRENPAPDSTVIGNSSRGAKFNCTKTYIKALPHPALGIVISEDGMIDLIEN